MRGETLALLVVLLLAGGFLRVMFGTYRLRRLLRAYQDAFDRGDADEADRLRATVERMARPPAQMRLVGEAEILLLRERWEDARAVLAKIRRDELPAANRPGVLSNLAYATAHAGQAPRGVALARSAIVEAKELGAKYPAAKLTALKRTLGIALSLAGDHAEAVRVLEEGVGAEEAPRTKAARAYFMGESLRALGRESDARAAYAKAAGLVGPWADRARAKIG